LTSKRSVRRSGCLLLACLLTACAGTRRQTPPNAPPGAMMGVYHARVAWPSEKTRRFRLLLWAQAPDRIHAEILAPLGTTELILDGGAGRLAVTVPRERVAYVGDADASSLAAILGLDLTLEQLVGALLGSGPPLAGPTYTREPRGTPGLPRKLDIDEDGHHLSLKLKRVEALRVSTRSLGTGDAPTGVELRPLEALQPVELPDDAVSGGDF